MSKMIDHTVSYIYCWNRLNEPNYMNHTENQISKMSNLGKLIFISPFSKNIFLLRSFTKTSTGQFDREFFADHFYTHVKALSWPAKASDPI